jgi:hypothetical protein
MFVAGTSAQRYQRLLQNPVPPGRVAVGKQGTPLDQTRLADPSASRFGE